ncbi:hypothetical protein VPH35_100348 [Triticum aestivum]
MADARGSVGTAADGLDLELRLGPPSAPIGYDIDLALFAGQIPVPLESVAVAEVERAGDLAIVGPVESAAAAAVEKGSDLAIVAYDGSVRGDDVPSAVTESVAVTEVDKASDLAIVVYEGQAGEDGDDAPPAVRELAVLATPDDEPQDEHVGAGQIVPVGSAGSTALALFHFHLPLQQVQPGRGIPLLPWAGRGARQSRRRAVAAAPDPALTSADTMRAWVRDELEESHHLPRDLLLTYIGEKVLSQSDMNSGQARFRLPASADARLRAFLNPVEIAACGFNNTERQAKRTRIPGERARPTTYTGVPLSVYVSSGRGHGVSDQLKLNKFHRSGCTVINGWRYRRFMEFCGLKAGDGVEVWAFRWPPELGPCLLIAKRDGVRPARNP